MNDNFMYLPDGSSLKIEGASYVGAPADNTVMFVSKKVEKLLENLVPVSGCLIFIEKNVVIPEEVSRDRNLFVRTDNPQRDYSCFVNQIQAERDKRNSERKYNITDNGYTIGENVTIGEGAYIEPGVFIDHDVKIGRRAKLLSGARIRSAVIGDDFIAGENCTIGTLGFNFAKDDEGNLHRIPSLGRVKIGNGVEVGAFANLTCGIAGDTIICDYTKIDVLVHVGHDVSIGRDTEVPAGVIIGGFARIGANAFLGVNSTIRNRIVIGDYAYIGMGAAVTKNIPSQALAMGVPAHVKGWMCTCGNRLDTGFRCEKCVQQYQLGSDGSLQNK